MFNKKCPRCKNIIKDSFKYCPLCSKNLRSEYDEDDYGFLGKNDFSEENTDLTDTFIDKMFNSAMKLLEKQMKNLNESNKNYYQPRLNVQFFVNGEKIFPEKSIIKHPIKVENHFTKEKLKKFLELPRKEPESRVKRISGKVIYELSVPGVKSIDNVLINQLENSIEIKALSDNLVYLKNLKVNLPILRCQLVDDSLIIEMQGR
ncbi:MAG: hypothetical protein AABW90_04000 [Nanoarchaeota archaeon]